MKRTPPPRKALDEVQLYSDEFNAPLNLSNNTPPVEPHPAVVEALRTFPPEKLHDYPTMESDRFREAASRVHGVRPTQIVTGNGSNDLLDMAIRVWCDPGDRVAWHPPSFELIATFARVNGSVMVPVPLRGEGFALDPEGLVKAGAKVTFVLSPNNPTGNAFPPRDVERVVEGCEGLVVVDEAYGDFTDHSAVPLVKEFPNLLVLRTMSKGGALAGLRMGYGIAQEPVIQALRKARSPYRVSSLTEHVATRVLERPDITRALVEETRREREALTTELRTRNFKVVPSDANFVFFRPTADAHKLHAALMARGVAVRKFGNPLIRAWLRTTVGPAWVTRRLLAELDDALREVGPSR